ncbi:MAG: Crp/Fnr family transcriptional regulator [Filimonas sp.]|nr:Crp/Fnr family transcriptional regulator [Filimonas sp.]
MFDRLRKNIEKKVILTDEEFAGITPSFKRIQLKKKERLLSNGQVSNFVVFVDKGSLRSYTIDEKGNEHILQFAFENYWIGDLYSYLTDAPSALNIEAMEATEVLYVSKTDMEALYEKEPKLDRFMRLQVQNAYVALQKRLNAAMSVPTEDRYLELMRVHPDILVRVPLIYIASYLGVTPESLSRIRRQLTVK